MIKKLHLLFAICLLFFAGAKAQYVTLTDTAFRSFLKGKYPTCFNTAGQLDTTCSAILNVTFLSLSAANMAPHTKVTNLHGLQYFKNLSNLNINQLPIKQLGKLPNALEGLYLKNLDSLSGFTNIPDSLNGFGANFCKLTNVPAFPFPNRSVGYFLDVSNNFLTSLPPLPKNLTTLKCSYNNLSTLPIDTSFMQMQQIDASHNQINTIPGGIPYTQWTDLSYNQLTSLPKMIFPAIELHIDHNNLTSLDLSKTFNATPSIWCQNNQLTSIILPNDNNYSSAYFLDCSNNPLTSLPMLKYWMNEVHIENTQIASLALNLNPLIGNASELNKLVTYNNNLTCLPPISFTYLKIDTVQFPCVPVASTVYSSTSGLSVSNYPVCNPTNAQYGCNASPIIKGKMFYDLNSNGVKDAGEFSSQYNRLNLSDGSYNFTDHTGFYEFTTGQLNTPLTLTSVVPSFYKAVPASKTFIFYESDTTVTWDIPMQPLGTKDSLSAFVTNYTTYSGPSGLIKYNVSWQNEGTTNLGVTNVVLKTDPAKLTFVSCSNAAVVQSGNQLTLQLPSLAAGTSGSYGAFFTIKSNVPFGDTAFANVAINSGTISSVDTTYTPIRYAFDPNDKLSTSAMSPQQISNGGFIDYTIRFQNTGNDTAINVVIADTLSPKLKANTMEVISTSHNCKVITKGNIVYFEMKNIMLPDSNVNETASHGFIRFKVKPVSTLALGDSVSNKAYIYFDFNSPVVTNSAVTQVAVQAFPLTLLSFTAKKENKTNLLNWKTTAEVNVSHFEIERSHNGREFSKIGTVKAGSLNYTFADNAPLATTNYYRLKMIDKDGSFSYSPVRLISNNSSFNVAIYPNPAKDKLQLQIARDKPTALQVQVVSLDGKILISNRFTANEANTLRSINISSLQRGSYLLKVSSANASNEAQVVKFDKF